MLISSSSDKQWKHFRTSVLRPQRHTSKNLACSVRRRQRNCAHHARVADAARTEDSQLTALCQMPQSTAIASPAAWNACSLIRVILWSMLTKYSAFARATAPTAPTAPTARRAEQPAWISLSSSLRSSTPRLVPRITSPRQTPARKCVRVAVRGVVVVVAGGDTHSRACCRGRR
jgi:hypothetical protein